MYLCYDCKRLFFDDEKKLDSHGPIIAPCCRSTLCIECARVHIEKVHTEGMTVTEEKKP